MISAIVLTKNEERHLAACLASLQWADDLLVLDSGSEDQTISIAKVGGARVEHRAFSHFGDQREAALRLARQPWVFFVDADERVPAALAKEVQQVVGRVREGESGGMGERENVTLKNEQTEEQLDDGQSPLHPLTPSPLHPLTPSPPHPLTPSPPHPFTPSPVGWWVPRRNFFWGREVRHSGWAPDYQLRLLRVDAARYDPDQHVHEVATLDGAAGWLKEPLIHINYDSWGEFWQKQRAYARHEGAKLAAQGLRWKPWNIVLQPLRAFRRRYVEWEGWKDGWLGLRLALAMAWWEGVAYLELKRLTEKE